MFERYQAMPGDEIIQIALIQAFEFTFEIAWKTMKDYLEHEGYNALGNSKQTVRVAFQAELIVEPEAWMMAIAQGNMTSHVALGTYKPASDVDIALKGQGVTSSLAARLKFDIEEDTYLPYFFDFVAYPTITRDALKAHINDKGVCIYCRVDSPAP